MDAKKQYALWRAQRLPDDLAAELAAMAGNADAIEGAFGAELQFGTAGMRGIMGAGTNRLNQYTVRRAAQGLAAWLAGTKLPQRCAIGYDTRHQLPAEYAEVCAIAMADRGIEAWLYRRARADTDAVLRCAGAGLRLRHHRSPPPTTRAPYNGVKCYGPRRLPDDRRARRPSSFAEIDRIAVFHSLPSTPWTTTWRTGRIQMHRRRPLAGVLHPRPRQDVPASRRSSSGAQTPRRLYPPVRDGQQARAHPPGPPGRGASPSFPRRSSPDGDFKTCEYPNPETDAALSESYKIARDTVHPDLILGTDPDCDRVAVAVPDGTGYRKLTGNELGVLLLDYILRTRKAQGTLPAGGEAICSIVSTPMAGRIARSYGCENVEVLTGFKYIGGEILRLEGLGQADRFLFGFEESCGYLKGTYARDKDAVVASMLLFELAAEEKLRGGTLLTRLDALYKAHGYFKAKVQSLELTGNDAMEKAAALMAAVRASCPASIAGVPVTQVRDYQSRQAKSLPDGAVTPLTLPKSNVLCLDLGTQGGVILRPSGTEPKVKLYYTAVGATEPAAEALLEAYMQAMQTVIALPA